MVLRGCDKKDNYPPERLMPLQWYVGEEDTYLLTPRSDTRSSGDMVEKRTPTS